mgnify:FL=1
MRKITGPLRRRCTRTRTRLTAIAPRSRSAGCAGAALLLLACAASRAAAQDVGPPLGSTPAPVVLEDLDGRPVDLADHIGRRPLFLEFWATWCPLCAGLQPRIDAAHERFGDRVQFLTIAVGVNQSRRSVRRHHERHPLAGLVLWDGQGRATRAFMARTTSFIVILDRDGKVVYTGVGADQRFEAALERVASPPAAPAGPRD